MSKYSPLPLEIASYKLTGGVDSKIQGLVLPPPKLQSCINAYVEQTGSIRRRFGRSSLAGLDQSGNTVNSLLALGTCQGRLLAYQNNVAFDYSEADSRWTNRGRATSYRMRARQVDAATPLAFVGPAMDMALMTNYRCYVFDYYTATSSINPVTAFTLVDLNGTVLASRQTLQTGAGVINTSCCKVVAFGTRFYIFYADTTTSTNLKCFIIDTTSASTIASSLAGAAVNTATNAGGTLAIFDVAVNSAQGPFIAYRSTTATTIAFAFVNTAGAQVNASTSATTGNAAIVSVDISGTTIHGIAYSNGGTPTDVYALIRTFSGGVWTATATSAALELATLTAFVRSVACHFDVGGTTLRVYYTTIITTYQGVRQGTFTSAGVLARRTHLLVHSELAARPFTVTGESADYYWVFREPEQGVAQPTFYLMKQDNTLAGWAEQGVAIMPNSDLNTALPHVPNLGTSYSFMHTHFTSISDQVTESGSVVAGTTSVASIGEVITDFTHADSHVAIEDGACTYLGSGILQQYDGVGFTEVGFLSFNDTGRTTLTPSTAAGGLTVNTPVSYRIVDEWTNAQGEREQGTDNGAKSVTLGATDNTVTIVVETSPYTLKKAPRSNIVKAVYRTRNTPTASSPFYRVGTVANDTTVETVTFVDTMSDAVAATQEQLYLATGELDNVAPPAAYLMAAGNGRVFLAGFPEDPTLIWYSKLRGHGQPLAFNDALTILIPAATGAIVALCVFAESLVVFTERAIYRVNGGGLSNTGASGGYTDPVVVQSDAGALSQRGVVVTPMGVLYESIRGKMLLTPSFTVQYIGASLEQLTAPGACTGSCLIPALQQVRFSYAATTHVYDYYHQQWYVFSHHSDGPTCLWNDVHTALTGDLAVYDNAAVWTDAGTAYAVTLTLAWMHTASLMGDITVRTVGLTGQILDVSYLTLYIAKDQEATNQTIDNTLTASGPLSRQWRIKKQVLKQIEVIIRDAILDVYGADVVQATAAWRLEELSFELALRSPRFGRGPGTVVIGI